MAHIGNTASKQLKSQDVILAGATAGFVTRGLSQPLDVLKIRFQLQVEPISNAATASKYKSMLQAAALIYREEGLAALWKGHVPAQVLSVSYGMVQFWTFDQLNRQQILPESYKPIVNFYSGALAGCTATLFSFPFDVLRTRLVSQSDSERVYVNMREAISKMFRNEGLLVFYRGLMPTFIQIGPYTGIQFMCFKLFDSLYRSLQSIDSSSFSLTSSAVSGSLAGLCAKVVVYPLDLTKKRLQIQGIEQSREAFGQVFSCRGMFNCLWKTYKHEGPLAFFKGLNASLTKAVVVSALHFATYDVACNVFLNVRSL